MARSNAKPAKSREPFKDSPLGILIKRVKEEKRLESQAATLRYVSTLIKQMGRSKGPSNSSIYGWNSGKHKIGQIYIEPLLRIGREIAKLDRVWAEAFLRKYADPNQHGLLDQYYPSVVLHNVPPLTWQVLGRDADIVAIRSILHSIRPGIIMIEGLKGSGTTVLAHQLAWLYAEELSTIPLNQRFRAIIWASARKKELRSDSIVDLIPSLSDLHSFFRIIRYVLNIVQDSENIDTMLHEIGTFGRCLFLLDDVENGADPQLIDFVRRIPLPSRVILTTHENLGPLIQGLTHHILPLADEHIENLLGGIVDDLTPIQRESLIHKLAGLPLAAKWISGHLYMGLEFTEIEDLLQQPENMLFTYLFDQTHAILRPPHRHTIFALRFFDVYRGAQLPALAKVCDCLNADMHARLDNLLGVQFLSHDIRQTTGEMDIVRESYRMHPLVHEFVKQKHDVSNEWENEARVRWVQWYLEYTKQHGGEPQKDWARDYEMIRLEWDNILNVLAWCEQHDEYLALKAFWLGDRLEHYTNLSGLWNERIQWMERLKIMANAQVVADWGTYAHASAQRGWTLSLLCRFHEALWEYEGAQQYASLIARRYDQCEFYADWGVAQWRHALVSTAQPPDARKRMLAEAWENLSKAEQLIDPEQMSATEVMFQRGNVAYYRAQIAIARKDYPLAEKLSREMLAFCLNNDWERGVIYAQSALAEALIALNRNPKDLDEARILIEASVAIARRNNERRRLAYSLFIEARWHQKQGETERMRTHIDEAIKTFHDLGMELEEQQARAFRDSII